MTDTGAEGRVGRVEFTGSRQDLLGIILHGYLVMIPTIGLYRFWQATWKRRYYWQNTIIDGEPLEYTGNASQLLFGFFLALLLFVPFYVALFVLAMQEPRYLIMGYAVLGALLWFMMGYASYRARDFRLSRTLWRGIRFDQRGSAIAYAVRRFLWSLLLIPTLGLAYPWMASSLWRYKWRNAWYGDRQFAIAGNWRVIAAPFYAAYVLTVLCVAASAAWIVQAGDVMVVGDYTIPGPIGLVLCAICVLVFAFSVAFYRTRVTSRMLSTVTLGETRLAMRIGPASLFGLFVTYAIAVVLLLALLVLTAVVVLGGIFAAATLGGRPPETALISAFQYGTLNVVLLILVYLLVLGALGLLAELILAAGWWRLLARGATIANIDALKTVRAIPEDRALVGQGLADALNVGSY
jgi:uncharacterized membrane protein YjgN (DUF898 family)